MLTPELHVERAFVPINAVFLFVTTVYEPGRWFISIP